jgi:hypothetical protein
MEAAKSSLRTEGMLGGELAGWREPANLASFPFGWKVGISAGDAGEICSEFQSSLELKSLILAQIERWRHA